MTLKQFLAYATADAYLTQELFNMSDFSISHDHDDHDCNPPANKTAHPQVPAFINGKHATIDAGLEELVKALNRMGFVTRFSCEGFNSMDDAHLNGCGDDRSYIMFEGEAAYEMLLRGLVLYSRQVNDWADEQNEVFDRMGFAEMTRDGELIAPAMYESRWSIELDREHPHHQRGIRFGTVPGGRVRYNTVFRMPKSDMRIFTQMVVEIMREINW